MGTNTKMQLGVTESRDSSNKVYVSLRTGKISEVSKDENESRPGFKPFVTENKSGTKYHFFAKTYDDLCGYVKDIRWDEHTLTDGTRLSGWKIHIDTGGKEYVLQVQSNDRPYQVLMSVLPNVDFNEPVRIIAFMGKDKRDKPQKVLLLTQNPDATAKDWIKPGYESKWMSLLLAQKIKEGEELTEEESRNVALDAQGKPDPFFPYIREKRDGSWSFDAWTEFLFEKMESEVIPKVRAAQERREEMDAAQVMLEDDDDDAPAANSFGSDFGGHVPPADDDIPFALIFAFIGLAFYAAMFGQIAA